MKVFVPGPDGYDTFAHNVAHALREMGHEVTTEPGERSSMKQSALQRAANELATRASKSWRLRADTRSLEIARRVRPNLTVICTRTYEPESIERMRRESGGLVVCWFGDAPSNLKRNHVVSGEYDAVFAKDPDFAASLRAFLGIEAHHLPEACNPAWHRPVAERNGSHLVIAGTSYGYRNAVVRRLLEAGREVRLYGPAPASWVPEPVRAAHTGRFLDHRDKAQVFGEALACINSFAPAEGANAVNCRVFESCACGGLFVSERRAALDAYFEPGVEYVDYASFDECLARLDELERDDERARAIRRAGARRAHADHSYRRRLERMLDLLDLSRSSG